MSLLPVKRAHQIDSRPPEQRWLVEHLWGAEAVGLIGGEPKLGKSTLALHLAIAVASGQPCLGRFVPQLTGRVLLYAAEDPPYVVRQRLEAIAAAAGLQLAKLDIYVITAPQLHLDQHLPRENLTDTIKKARPKLLILDPFVRLHSGIDENSVAEVAPILAHLRYLQRTHHLAVALVHHSRKTPGRIRPGQALRGSSEFHAWGDSNLYLREIKGQLRLTIEHRAARAPADVPLTYEGDEDTATLRIIEPAAPSTTTALTSVLPDPRQRIEKALADARGPMTVRQLRPIVRARTETICEVLRELIALGRVQKNAGGYQLQLPLP
jgi:hypothetical protein